MEIERLALCTRKVLIMKEQNSVENSAYLVLDIELLLTVLSNVERKPTLKESAF